MIRLIKTYLDYYLGVFAHIRRKPRTLQFPITSRCNSRCLTCNIWKQHDKKDVSVENLETILTNPFFSKLHFVGLNGGEPTLHNNFVEVVKVILNLPELKAIAIISNCINSNRLLNLLKIVKPLCKEKGVRLSLQISIDGIGGLQDFVRGIRFNFEKSLATLNELCQNKDQYVDSFDVGCTISKYNVDYLSQMEEFFSDYDVPVYYHLAVPNKRIHNFDDAPFSVLTDKHATQMAKEFFYSRISKAHNRIERIRYTLIYLYLAKYTNKRTFICNYLYQDITIDENLDTFLCATASEKVGSIKNEVPTYKEYNNCAKITKMNCNTCIHYANFPNIRGLLVYIKYRLSTYMWVKKYKLYI